MTNEILVTAGEPPIEDVRLLVEKSFGISQSWHVFAAMQAGLTAALVAANSRLPERVVSTEAISFFAFSIVLGTIIEAQTLKKKGISSNPAAVLANGVLKNPYLAASCGAVYSLAQSFVINPADFVSLVSLPFPGGAKLFSNNLVSKSAVGFAYQASFNWMISKGKIDGLFSKLGDFYEKSGLKKIDYTIFPERVDFGKDTSLLNGNF